MHILSHEDRTDGPTARTEVNGNKLVEPVGKKLQKPQPKNQKRKRKKTPQAVEGAASRTLTGPIIFSPNVIAKMAKNGPHKILAKTQIHIKNQSHEIFFRLLTNLLQDSIVILTILT